MDFSLGSQAEEFRAEVKGFLADHMTDEIRHEAWRSGTLHNWEFHRALAGRGWVAPHLPAELGGSVRDDFDMVAMNEELAFADAPNDGRATTMLVVETLRHVGTPEQQRTIIPRVLAGEILICLGFSEPDSGSDVASAKTTAVRDGDQWVITGQKMFTSLAQVSAYVFLLARTNPDAPKHKGLTMFLVPLDAPGVAFTPIETLGDQLVNVTFFNDVRIDDSMRLGAVDEGWSVMTVGLSVERTTPVGPAAPLARVIDWAHKHDPKTLDDPHVRAALAWGLIDSEVSRLLLYNAVWTGTQGRLPTVEGSMAKLYGSESYNRVFADLLDAVGPDALRQSGEVDSFADGEVEHSYRYAPYYSIAGGVSEIQREIIAQRGLGLPRSR